MNHMLEIARSLAHPPTLAAALSFMSFVSFYDRNWTSLLEYSKEALSISLAEGFSMWRVHAQMYNAWALHELEPSPSTQRGLLKVPLCFGRQGLWLQMLPLPALSRWLCSASVEQMRH